MDNNIYNRIYNKTHAYTLWNNFEILFTLKIDNNKLFLLKKICILEYKPPNSIVDHLSEFHGVINQL